MDAGDEDVDRSREPDPDPAPDPAPDSTPESEPEPEISMDEDGPSPERLDAELEELRSEFEELEARLEDRIVHRRKIESELQRYVRRRIRRGHARGWGPYLVLLYGTLMTIGAFYFLSGGWAILAMLVVWLSTLGMYVLMILVGVSLSVLELPKRGIDRLRQFRE